MLKICLRCGKKKDQSEFHKDKQKRDGYRPYCKECIKIYFFKNKKRFKRYRKRYYKNNKKQISNRVKELHKLHPWKNVLQGIKQRCNNPNATGYEDYGGRNIKFNITEKELKQLMIRDGYWKMKQPTIDRIDNDGDYTYDNCRFIERPKNVSRQDKTKQKRIILQFDLSGLFIKEWESMKKVEDCLGIKHANIIKCINGLRNHTGGFRWEYKQKGVYHVGR